MRLSINRISKILGGFLLITSLFLVSCQQDPSTTMKPLLDSYVNAWNTGELDDLDQFLDADFVRNSPATANSDAVGIDSLRSVINQFRAGFPDMNVTINDELYSENKASIRWTVTATNTGPMDMPPTGKEVEINGISMFSFKDGKIAEEWVEFDNRDFSQQLGFAVLPPAPPIENDPTVVDPDHYQVAFENERVRVLRISYGPGEKSVMHDHREGVTVFFDDAEGQFTLPDGSTVETGGDAREVGWAPGGSHLPENTGDEPFELVLIELKTQ